MAKTLLVVAHAPSPNTRLLRDAVLRGASNESIDGVALRSLTPFEAEAADVKAADGVLLGTTENLGYMSGALKDFFDRVYYPCLEETQGRPYATFIRAGLDGTGTRRAIESICSGLRWKPVRDPVVCRGDWDPKFEADCEELGTLMAAGLEAGIF